MQRKTAMIVANECTCAVKLITSTHRYHFRVEIDCVCMCALLPMPTPMPDICQFSNKESFIVLLSKHRTRYDRIMLTSLR
jgi:hypothetical protein